MSTMCAYRLPKHQKSSPYTGAMRPEPCCRYARAGAESGSQFKSSGHRGLQIHRTAIATSPRQPPRAVFSRETQGNRGARTWLPTMMVLRLTNFHISCALYGIAAFFYDGGWKLFAD